MRKASRRRGASPEPASLGLEPTKEVMKWVLTDQASDSLPSSHSISLEKNGSRAARSIHG